MWAGCISSSACLPACARGSPRLFIFIFFIDDWVGKLRWGECTATVPMDIGSSTSSGLTTLRRSTDDSFWPCIPSSSSSKITPGESTIRSPRSSCTDCSSFVCPGCAATAQAYISPPPRRARARASLNKKFCQGGKGEGNGPWSA